MIFSTLTADAAFPLSENLIWGAPDWVIPVSIAAVILAALTLWNYTSQHTMGAVRWLAAALKIVAVALIAICLLQPMRSGTRPRPKANVLPILVDNSKSMQVKPKGAKETRADVVAKQIAPENDWRIRLEQDFDVRGYSFDSRIAALELTAPALSNEGTVSSLSTSLQSLGERFAARPVAGVVLFSDGNLTDPPDTNFDWSTLGFPVYPVLSSTDETINDVRIADVSVSQTDFESAPVTIRVKVDANPTKRKLVVQLLDLDHGKLVEEQTITTSASETDNEVTFRFRPDVPGLRFYRTIVFEERDRQALDAKRESKDSKGTAAHETFEATLVNNQRMIAVDRKSGPYRILYVAGRPNWDFKFLRRSLAADAEIQLVGLLRIANKEPKFSFRDQGVSGSSSANTNRLFDGVDSTEDELVQQYDEPVMIRLGVKESEELSDGFPETREELFAYHAIILDDIESEYFTQDQMLLMRQFVSSRGGGLLMLGGQESFAGKSFADSPLGELAPVYGPRSGDASVAGAYRMKLTREGMLEPWARLRENESAESDRFAQMPPFTSVNAVGDVKPGALTLATVQDRTGDPLPAIVAQRFGKGRTAAMPIADLWRWSMRHDPKKKNNDGDDAAQAWRQMAHWLVGDVPRQVEARVEPNVDPNEPARIMVHVRDEAYLPIDNAEIELTITPVEKEIRDGSQDGVIQIQATADDDVAGLYRAAFWTNQSNAYRVHVAAKSADGHLVGEADTGWVAQPDTAEFRQLGLNRPLLETIAKQSGGKVIANNALADFAAELPNLKIPVTETWVYPLWHNVWVLVAAILCLCGEWGLRRWKGLS
ncbi:glutamine amidotransferase [Novipirellula sp.]|uniref:glutamine amidotransferase n=1 Tax=Novipirellula sp. TaxID=2795430 RepID=UPI003569943C